MTGALLRVPRVADQVVRVRRAVGRPARPRVLLGPATGPAMVYVLAPDLDEPIGGVRAMYRHVDLLVEAGIPAAVLHQRPSFRCTWFPNRTPVRYASRSPVSNQDLLVVPELDVDVAAQLAPGRRHVIFNQSGHLTWQVGGRLASRHYGCSPDLLAVVTVSEHSRRLLSHSFPALRVERVRPSLDPFFLPAERPAARRLAHMPRRGSRDVDIVLEILRARGALRGWDVVALGGLGAEEIAAAMRTCSIFLSSSYQEGFGLPPAEAMASACYVIGYDGFGGREYFHEEFSRPVPTGDVLAFAQAVETAILAEEAQPGWCWSRGRAASDWVRDQYSRQRESDELVPLIEELLGTTPAGTI